MKEVDWVNWQFKNGTMGKLSLLDLFEGFGYSWNRGYFVAWDRSLGTWVYYES